MDLIDKKRLVRFIKFGLIGSTGIVVNTSALWVFHALFNIPVFFASPLAIALAIFNNFTWNDRFTWKENRGKRKFTYGHRLWKYYVSASLGAFINYVTLIVLSTFLGLNYLISNLIGILFGMISNFILSELWVFQSKD